MRMVKSSGENQHEIWSRSIFEGWAVPVQFEWGGSGQEQKADDSYLELQRRSHTTEDCRKISELGRF